MIFQETWGQVLDGTKTQTRRAVKSDDCTPCAWKAVAGDWFPVDIEWTDGQQVLAVLADGPRLRFRTGKTIAVQPSRGKKQIARITVTAIRYCERAGGITEEDAIAEGFATAEEFRETYARINGAGALDAPCWALTFLLVEGAR